MKTGKTSYSFTKKPTQSPVECIPEGFEIYESPDNGQVLLRKTLHSAIRDDERGLVEQAIRRLTDLPQFIVDRDEIALVIWTPDNDESTDRLTELMGGFLTQASRDYLTRRSRFSKMLRFSLDDPVKRLFSAERWCFLGSIDKWVQLTYAKSLPVLLEKYVPHLAKESFFELI
jgi:hypothetical protein